MEASVLTQAICAHQDNPQDSPCLALSTNGYAKVTMEPRPVVQRPTMTHHLPILQVVVVAVGEVAPPSALPTSLPTLKGAQEEHAAAAMAPMNAMLGWESSSAITGTTSLASNFRATTKKHPIGCFFHSEHSSLIHSSIFITESFQSFVRN